MKTCSKHECEGKVHARGLCSRHYQDFRLKRKVAGYWDDINRGFRDTCEVDSCEDKHAANGMCEMHYRRSIKEANRKFVVERYFSEGIVCPKCKKEFELIQMDAHHPNPARKERGMSHYLNNSAMVRRPGIIAEMDECEFMCCRCHQNLHHDPSLTHEDTYGNIKKGRQIDRRKEMVRAARGETCEECTDWLYPKEMEFHHRDGAEKTANVSDLLRTASKQRIMDEVAKCDIVCRNCHRLAA